MKRGQASIELLVFVSAAVVLLIVYTAISHHYLNLLYTKEEMIEADDVLKGIVTEINSAGRVDNGYSRTIDLPETISNRDYKLLIGKRDLNTGGISGDSREIVVYFEGNEFVERASVSVMSCVSCIQDLSEKWCDKPIYEYGHCFDGDDSKCTDIGGVPLSGPPTDCPNGELLQGGSITINKDENEVIIQ
jgi:hypothetical protein